MAASAAHANGAAPRPQREKVTFPTNLPVAVQLEDGDGNLTPGAYGDSFRYWLTGHQIMFVEPSVHNAIQDAGAAPFDEFLITKTEQRKGSRRAITWHVEKIQTQEPDDETEQRIARQIAEAEAADAAAAAAAQAQRQPPARAVDTAASAARATEPAAQAPAAIAAPAPGPRLVQPPQERPQLTGQHAAEARLTECLLAAIRATRAAEVYAGGQELAVRFTSEDLRAFALSLYISAEKGGR